MTNKRLKTILIAPLLVSAAAGQASTKQALLMAMGANAKQMASFQWKQKTTVIRKGKASDPAIEEFRFDASGQLQHVTLVKPEQKRMGPIRSRKAADIKESVQEVMQLARRYANPQQISQAIQKGDVWEGDGRLRVEAHSVVLPMDQMTMVVNSSTYLATRIDFKTQYEGDPVAIAIQYEQFPNGPSMMTRMTVQIPKEDIAVHVESFDFVRLAGPIAN